jgi:hypothetical protein
MAIKGSALGLNKDSRQHTPEKILNIKIHKSDVSKDCETKENTKDQISFDKSKDEGKTISHKTSNREKNGKVDPQEWMRDQELSGKQIKQVLENSLNLRQVLELLLEEEKTPGLHNNTAFSGASFDNSLSMQTIDQRGF